MTSQYHRFLAAGSTLFSMFHAHTYFDVRNLLVSL